MIPLSLRVKYLAVSSGPRDLARRLAAADGALKLWWVFVIVFVSVVVSSQLCGWDKKFFFWKLSTGRDQMFHIEFFVGKVK